MDKYTYVVFSNPAEGREEEFNSWYDEVHLAEVCLVPGVTGAVRYAAPAGTGGAHRYLALYNLEGDGDAIVAEIARRGASGEFRMSSALDRTTVQTLLYRQITPEG